MTPKLFEDGLKGKVLNDVSNMGDYFALPLLLKETSVRYSFNKIVVCDPENEFITVYLKAISKLDVLTETKCEFQASSNLYFTYREFRQTNFGYTDRNLRGDFIFLEPDTVYYNDWYILRIIKNKSEFWLICQSIICRDFISQKGITAYV